MTKFCMLFPDLKILPFGFQGVNQSYPNKCFKNKLKRPSVMILFPSIQTKTDLKNSWIEFWTLEEYYSMNSSTLLILEIRVLLNTKTLLKLYNILVLNYHQKSLTSSYFTALRLINQLRNLITRSFNSNLTKALSKNFLIFEKKLLSLTQRSLTC